MDQVYLGLGANLNQPIEQLNQALVALENLAGCTLVKSSGFYSSKPMGPQDQPDYVNAVVAINTSLSPLCLLAQTQKIELALGRVRKKARWGPRTLDIDILLFADNIIDNEQLTVPHYGMKLREFVLYPLFEIAPDLSLPDGTHITDLLKKVPLNGLTKIS